MNIVRCPKAVPRGRIQRGQGGHAPQSSIESIFNGKSRLCCDCSLHQKCSVDLKYALPRPTPLGAFGASILDRAFGAQLRWSPNGKSWLGPRAHRKGGGGSKTENGGFPCKIALHLKKVGYKVSLCEYCQRQSCNAHSLAYLSVQKWFAVDVPYVKI